MEPYLGEIRIFGGNFAPVGWNFCDGTLLDIASNDALFSLLGTTYGGNGITNFALPDLRGRVPIHRKPGTYDLGANGGMESVPLVVNNIPQHTHTFAAGSAEATASNPAGQFLAGSASAAMFGKAPPTVPLDQSSIGASTGSAVPHENMQPFQCINYIIALAGIFPSQS